MRTSEVSRQLPLEQRLPFAIAISIAVASCFGVATFDHPTIGLAAGLPIGATVAMLMRYLGTK